MISAVLIHLSQLAGNRRDHGTLSLEPVVQRPHGRVTRYYSRQTLKSSKQIHRPELDRSDVSDFVKVHPAAQRYRERVGNVWRVRGLGEVPHRLDRPLHLPLARVAVAGDGLLDAVGGELRAPHAA